MPKSGVGRGLALGIEQGANNFLQSFLAVKQFKEQQKYRKLQPVIEMMQAQISDPNLPLDQKIKAMDTLPLLLDPNYKGGKLSEQLGLDKLAQQEIDGGEQIIQGTKGGLIEDQSAVDANKKSLKVGDASNPDLVSTENVLATSINQAPTKTLKKRSLKRRGEMTANDLILAKQAQINKSEQEDQFQRQYKLAQVNADLQFKTLAQQGWKNNGDWTFNKETNSWTQEWFNPITKETYDQNLQPGIVPESVILKQIQAGGKSGGVSMAYKTLREAVATSMGKEVDDPEVNIATANMWKNNFSLGVVKKVQDTTGTEPITKNQQFNNDMQVLQAQQKHGELVASSQASLNNVTSLADRKNQAWQNAANAKADFDKIKDDYDAEDREYQTAQAAYNRANDDANRLETEYQNALKSHNKLQEQVGISEQNLKSAGVNSSGEIQQFSPRMKTRIVQFKKDNPNAQLSDAQIANLLKSQGFND